MSEIKTWNIRDTLLIQLLCRTIYPVNSMFISAIATGEGWHNYHVRFLDTFIAQYISDTLLSLRSFSTASRKFNSHFEWSVKRTTWKVLIHYLLHSWDYRAAELGTPFNLTCKFIDFFANYGAIYDRREATATMVCFKSIDYQHVHICASQSQLHISRGLCTNIELLLHKLDKKPLLTDWRQVAWTVWCTRSGTGHKDTWWFVASSIKSNVHVGSKTES